MSNNEALACVVITDEDELGLEEREESSFAFRVGILLSTEGSSFTLLLAVLDGAALCVILVVSAVGEGLKESNGVTSPSLVLFLLRDGVTLLFVVPKP